MAQLASWYRRQQLDDKAERASANVPVARGAAATTVRSGALLHDRRGLMVYVWFLLGIAALIMVRLSLDWVESKGWDLKQAQREGRHPSVLELAKADPNGAFLVALIAAMFVGIGTSLYLSTPEAILAACVLIPPLWWLLCWAAIRGYVTFDDPID